MSKTIYIGGRLESKEKGNVVTGANAILDDTKGKKQNVINKETDDELLRLEQSKQDNLTFDNAPTEDSTNPVTSGGVYTAEKALSDAIEAILLLIPSAATALNKLVDTNTMNSSISTATATFRGTYNAVSDLGLTYQATHAQIEAALDALGLTADNNDFAFVQIPVSDQSQDIAKTERFKFNGTNWLYEYDLNTSGFTAAQWAAINSGITVALVTKLTDLPTAAALQLALNAKQDTLTFDTTPTASSTNPVTSGGIYLAIQAVATALSNYSDTTDNRLNTLEGLIPTEASSSNKLTDKAYVDGLIQAITELIPAEADTTNQLADKAYVLAQILAATPACKGQFVTLAELQAVASPKAGDLGIVRTKDSDGMDVFTVYQYLNNAWNVFYSLSYHPQTKPATTGTTGDYPYNGMGRVELAKNMVNTGTEFAPVMVNQLTQDMFYKGAVGSRVPNTNTIFVIRYDYVLGEDITIPSDCVLLIDGGSISGAYTITGANTGIIAGLVKIFSTNIILAGTWNVAEAYPEWFGILANDESVSLSDAMNNLNVLGKVIFQEGTYNTNLPVKIINAEGVFNKTIIQRKGEGNGIYTAWIGDLEHLTSDQYREPANIKNIKFWINGISTSINSSCALLVGNVGNAIFEGCEFSSYVGYATENITEAQRIQAAKENNVTIESMMNCGMKIIGYIEGFSFIRCRFGGMVGIYSTSDSVIDAGTFNNCILTGSPRGYAGLLFNGGISSTAFMENTSFNQFSYCIKSYHNFNGITLIGGRSEQNVALLDSDDNNKTLGSFIYVDSTINGGNSDIINLDIDSFYVSNSNDAPINGLYLKAYTINGSAKNVYSRYNVSYGKLKHSFSFTPTETAVKSRFILDEYNIGNGDASFGNGTGIIHSNFISLDSYDSEKLKNSVVGYENYEWDTSEYKRYNSDEKTYNSSFLTRGTGSISLRFTKRLKDIENKFTCCVLKGVINTYSGQTAADYDKTFTFEIVVDRNGNIVKQDIDSNTHNIAFSVDTSTCIVSVYTDTLYEVIGRCEFIKSSWY